MNIQDNLITVPKTLGIVFLEMTTAYPIPVYKNSTDNIYRIVTNEDTFETCYIKINEYCAYNQELLAKAGPYKLTYKYETWLNYLEWSHKFIEKKNIVIYDKPNGNVIFENKNDNFLPFGVVKMDGDWIKLRRVAGYSDKYGDYINYDCWTQWKDGEKLLIEIQQFGEI